MFQPSSTFADALESPAGRAILVKYLPGIAASPMAEQLGGIALSQVIELVPDLQDPTRRERLWAELAKAEELPFVYGGVVDPDVDYEDASVERGSALVALPPAPRMWAPAEVVLRGPSHGNPFVDVELTATFRNGDRVREVGGFYDGEGRYLIRFLPDAEGEWEFLTASTARSLDAITGTLDVGPADHAARGPVRVDGMHFRYADGSRHRPLGTTAYAWVHQDEELQEQTLAALAGSPFTKLRMCVFPKSYLYNANEPHDFVFPGTREEGFDFERFDPGFFHRLERRIEQLGELGIEADVILFHAYDRWGFADMGPAVDDRYVQYVVRRLAAYPNVWWSMANEFDLLAGKDEDDWERLAAIVRREDHVGHLNSIHNCVELYDYSRPWITHVSIQRVDVYRTAENTDHWRDRWHKPVIIDECGYEGDVDQGWGNLTGQEMTRRFWEGAVRGGYVGHGETYINDAEVLWWAKGGELTGTSPERIAFLDRILEASPTGIFDPLPSDWDLPWGGTATYRVAYFGFNQPRFRNLLLPSGEWSIDVIDTWNMTIEPVSGTHTGWARVELPARQFMAIRCTRTGEES